MVWNVLRLLRKIFQGLIILLLREANEIIFLAYGIEFLRAA